MPRPRLRAGAGAASSIPLFVAYYRVSTDQQGRSGPGLEAQKAAVASFMAGQVAGRLIAEYEEVESGKSNDRPELAAALAARRATLVIAKIDRLARNARFLLSVVEGSGDAGVAFCDLPQVPPGPTGKFLLTLLAAVAELEARLISQRTKAALAAKARGVKLGGRKLVAGFDTAAARSGRAASYADKVLPYYRGEALITSQADGEHDRLRDMAPKLTKVSLGGRFRPSNGRLGLKHPLRLAAGGLYVSSNHRLET